MKKLMEHNNECWEYLNKLVMENEIIIDRPKGTRHPKYKDLVYELDYGYIKNTKDKVGPMHSNMAYGKSGGVAPLILNLDSRRKSVVSTMPRPHYLRGKIKIYNTHISH